ncbi:MAG TPA: siroheme synthase CysG [Steroidobacteraceae bacterium]|nr:siroheme synthase CysG [Steroidobacteraceae bacterium]
MRYFPLFVDLKDRAVVVVGGGAIAERKVALLAPSGARLTVVAPELSAGLAALRAAGRLVHTARAFAADDLDGARLVIAATGDRAVNGAVAAAAEARGILANVVDDLELSDAILPAIVDRSPLVVAISTQGTAPALARRLRAEVEVLLDGALGRIARFAAAWRARIKAKVPDLAARRRAYDWLADGPPGELVRRAQEPAAARCVAEALASSGPAPWDSARAGSVALVGAGPGDPGLVTLAGLRALQGADVVLYDRLVSPEVLALARREALRIAVGKQGGGHSVAQAAIHDLMVEHARAGRRVVRLKGGDPMIFGRGGEELEHLRRAGVAYEVVPGVTAALACAAYAGIPLTHREHSASVRFVTAHCRESVDATDWQALAAGRETLAVYMGVATLPLLRRELLRHGRRADTPVALVENGSRAEQRVVVGTLEELESLAHAHAVRAPALLIVGDVAALAATLHWFGAAPIAGAAIATRTAA